jgi:diguanylate cyclase (GGDEF)-like protein
VASLASAAIWLGADLASGHIYTQPTTPVWNFLIRLSLFLIITLLFSSLRKAMSREKEMARTDYLTGAVNGRRFFELVQMEIDRLQRYKHTFTLVYLDLDNFKGMNDKFGHHMGDQILCRVVSYMQRHVRKTDVIARLGGDEFALLLPETPQGSARIMLNNLQIGLLGEMQKEQWPITFSFGVVTCHMPPTSVDELLRIADGLMYSVKREGKNAIQYVIYSGSLDGVNRDEKR